MGSSSVGGSVGPALRRNGIQSIKSAGRSPDPSYPYIANGEVEIRDAGQLWGLTTEEAARRSVSDHVDVGLVMLIIGPAGEQQSIACSTAHRGYAAGRTGLGAVMGAKNLKAIVVAGQKRAEGLDPDVRGVVRRYTAKIMAARANTTCATRRSCLRTSPGCRRRPKACSRSASAFSPLSVC